MSDAYNTIDMNAEDPFKTIVQSQKDPYTGGVIGNCRLLEKIGEGGMALVYKARHQTLDVDRVIKILRPHFYNFENYQKRFLREARLVALLNHPNIVHVHNTGEKGQVVFIEMEYVEGETLRARLERDTKLSPDEMVRIGRQLSKALEYAHNRVFKVEGKEVSGMVHRDIKPENIMITPEGNVKLMDFGIAKPTELTTDTVPGSVVGTYAYMSPEQIEGETVDYRSDLYSLAVVCYEMLTGSLPYTGTTVTQLAMQITSGKTKLLSGEGIPAGLRKVLAKGIKVNPDGRFKSAELFGRALESEKSSRGSAKKGIRIVIAAAALFAALASGTAVIFQNSERPREKEQKARKLKPVPEVQVEKKKVEPVSPVKKPVGPPKKKVAKKVVKKPVRKAEKKRARPRSPEMTDLQKGKSLQKIGRWVEAIAVFEKIKPPSAGGNEKTYVDARIQIAKINLNALRQAQEAERELKTLYRYFSYAEISNLLGQCYIRGRNYNAAKKVLENAGTKSLSGRTKRVQLEINYNLGMALEGLIMVQNQQRLLDDGLRQWQKVKKLACGFDAKFCRQAEAHISKLKKISLR